MRSIFLMMGLLLASPALADDCGKQNSEILTLKSWTAKQGEYMSIDITMQLQNNADKQIRMIKAAAVFIDPFGESIARLALDPDVVIPAKGTIDESGSWSAARLAKVRPQDVTTLICVSAVLYEDGSKETFE